MVALEALPFEERPGGKSEVAVVGCVLSACVLLSVAKPKSCDTIQSVIGGSGAYGGHGIGFPYDNRAIIARPRDADPSFMLWIGFHYELEALTKP